MKRFAVTAALSALLFTGGIVPIFAGSAQSGATSVACGPICQ